MSVMSPTMRMVCCTLRASLTRLFTDFKDADGNDCMKQAIQDNYNQIKEDVKQIVKDEQERIAGDENLKHLVQKQ